MEVITSRFHYLVSVLSIKSQTLVSGDVKVAKKGPKIQKNFPLPGFHTTPLMFRISLAQNIHLQAQLARHETSLCLQEISFGQYLLWKVLPMRELGSVMSLQQCFRGKVLLKSKKPFKAQASVATTLFCLRQSLSAHPLQFLFPSLEPHHLVLPQTIYLKTIFLVSLLLLQQCQMFFWSE